MPPENTSVFGKENPGDLLSILGALHGMGVISAHLAPYQLRQLMQRKHLKKLEQRLRDFGSIVPWELPPDVMENREALRRFADELDVEEMAWFLRSGRPIRLAIQKLPEWLSREKLINLLTSGKVFRPSSIFFDITRSARKPVWERPVRVGFVDVPDSDWLHSELQTEGNEEYWSRIGSRLLPPQKHRYACELLLLPIWKIGELEDLPIFSTQCGLLLVLADSLKDRSSIFASIREAERIASRGSGAYLAASTIVAVPREKASDFVLEILHHLAVGQGVDEALFAAAARLNLPHPLIAGGAPFMEQSGGRSGGIWRLQWDILKMAGEPPEFDMLLSEKRAFSLINLEALSEPAAPRERPPAERRTRFLQCQVRRNGTDLETAAFLAGEKYSLKIRIGYPAEDWLQSQANVPFPQEKLPAGRKKYTLTVVFLPVCRKDILGFGEDTAERKTIELVEEGGESTEAEIGFVATAEGDTFDRRVIVLYENRILQTGRLRGPIVRDKTEGSREKIRFDIEAVVSSQFSQLGGKTSFGQTFLVNADEEGEPGITSVNGSAVKIFSPDGLPNMVKILEGQISQIANEDETFFGKLGENDDLRRTMVLLARAGADLLEILNEYSGIAEKLSPGSPVQILSKIGGKKLPIEFLYDHELPKEDAELCPGALRFLEGESCPHEHGRDVFCPSGFWGLNRVIERHAFKPGISENQDFTLQSEPVKGRQTLSLGKQALFGGTHKVNKSLGAANGLARIKAQLKKTRGTKCKQAFDWNAWEAGIKAAPRLLVLVVHTGMKNGVQTMAIGKDKWLSYFDIRVEHAVCYPPPGPILFLIGCETNSPNIAYASLAEKFRRKGVSVVVSSDVTIHARHAVPVVEKLLEELRLQTENSDGLGFGAIMQKARRKLLADGVPVVLCITAIGDADWQIKS